VQGQVRYPQSVGLGLLFGGYLSIVIEWDLWFVGLLWKIYSGYKKSTRQEASVFIFEKKELDKWVKKDRERMIETLKKGVQQLTKLRHPRVLTVQHPLEESRLDLTSYLVPRYPVK